jgi:hypothetical protein
MHRRPPLGNGRRLAIVGAVLLIVGCLLPWYVLGGTGALPPVVLKGWPDGSGVLSFLAGLGTLALVALPYAAERRVAVDRALTLGILAIVALAGVALWIPTRVEILEAPEGLLPDRAYGFWIAAVGAIALARAAYDIHGEPPRDY